MVGVHLLVQGVLAQVPQPDEVYRFLLDLAGLLTVQPISGPHVFPNCAIVIIAESHLSCHWQETERGVGCWIDAFSCKDFDTENADAWIKATLPFVSVEPSQVLRRGPLEP